MSKSAPASRGAVALVLAGVALLAMAPMAAALPQPLVYFLRDTPLPAAPAGFPHIPIQGVPLGPGELITLAPPGLPPIPTNTTDPQQYITAYQKLNATQQRMVMPEQELVQPAQFVSNTTGNTGRIYGPIITLLFLPNSPTIRNGNLSAQLVVLPKGAAITDIPPKGEVIASASFVLDYNSSSLPNPTSLVPPDPTDPPGSAGYVESVLLAYGFGQIGGSYKVAYLRNATGSLIIDKTVPTDSTVALRMVLEPGSSPGPVAIGAGQPVVYNNVLTPSFVYVPWYSADPPRTTPTYTPPTSTPTYGSGTSYGNGAAATTVTPTKKKSPGLEVPLVIVGLAALVLVARRRMQ